MRFLQLLFTIGLCLFIGFSSAQLTNTQTEWFNELEKPQLYPPSYLFGIVWSVLYVFMGVSLYIIMQQTRSVYYYVVFSIQLILNFFWTLIFFNLQNILFALIEILVLWLFILYTIILFYQKSTLAAYLLIPYLLWVSFATFLTIRLFIIN